MAHLQSELKSILKWVNDHTAVTEQNQQLFEIWEGNLLEHALEEYKNQLVGSSFETAKTRLPPINILRRIVDKLSKIYNRPPMRTIDPDSPSNQKLFDFYLKETDFNNTMGLGNEFFNLFKQVALEPFVDDGLPKIRVVPPSQFIFYSNDIANPTKPTHYIKRMGKEAQLDGTEKEIFWVFSKDEFLIIDEDGKVRAEQMAQRGLDGTNPFGVLPATYVNRSKHLLVPLFDNDMLRMTKLIPILLADLNFAAMFQSFSMFVGIDIKTENLKISPNAFLNIKSEADGGTPSFDVVKPEVDIEAVINMTMTELVLWLESKNIRPGAVGQVGSENFASGVSKIVDEMDTFEDRQNQVPYFRAAEEDLWDRIMNHMHPVWVKNKEIDQTALFAPDSQVTVVFPEQRPLMKRSEILADLEKERSLGLFTVERAIRRLEPDLTDEEVTKLELELKQANVVVVEENEEEEALPAEE